LIDLVSVCLFLFIELKVPLNKYLSAFRHLCIKSNIIGITSVRNVILTTLREINSISLSESGRCSYSISAHRFRVSVIDCATLRDVIQNLSPVVEYERCVAVMVV
jgi:hypothetical protein